MVLLKGNMPRYQDEEGREIFVSDGLAAGQYYCSFRRKPNGISVKRVKTRFLPLRKRREEAQADLNAYAQRKGWQPL